MFKINENYLKLRESSGRINITHSKNLKFTNFKNIRLYSKTV